MTQWIVTGGDILQEKADVLVCSANPFLTLSGGVGGALLLRYGTEMQEYLRRWLDQKGLRHVPRGTVVRTPACGTPYRCVLHAVAVDGAYQSSAQIVTEVVARALHMAVEEKAATVALPALATGYGRLTLPEFAEGLRPLIQRAFDGIERVTVCVRHEADIETVARVLKEAEAHPS